MNLFDKIDDILEQENNILPKGKTKVDTSFSFDEKIFSKMANFIINLEPDKLTDSQIEEVIDMIEKLEVEVEDIQEEGNPKLARMSTSTKNQASKKWYSTNKTQIKKRKERLKRSSEGRKRLRTKERLESQGRTSTGRRKVKYHVRKRSDRNN